MVTSLDGFDHLLRSLAEEVPLLSFRCNLVSDRLEPPILSICRVVQLLRLGEHTHARLMYLIVYLLALFDYRTA